MNRNFIYMMMPALMLAAGLLSGCAEEEFRIVVKTDSEAVSEYDPWYPDDEKEDELDLVEMPNFDDPGKAWEACITAKIDRTYNGYFTRDKGMNGCDGVYTTELPDGSIFWSFGDSYFGMLCDSTLRIRGGSESNFPRNAVIIQTKQNYRGFHCLNEYVQTDDPFKTNYYKGRTFLRSPKGEQTDESIISGSIDQQFYYWPGDATVIERDGKKILQILWGECYKTEDGGMGRYGTALTEHDVTGKPGDEGYMKRITYLQEYVPYITNFGSALFECEEDGHLYIYGEGPHSDGMGKGPVVARVKDGYDLTSQWEYWVNTGTLNRPDFVWRDEVPTRDELIKSRIVKDWSVQPNIFRKGEWYYMVTQGILSPDVYIYRSKSPYKGFDENGRRKLFRFPDTLEPMGKIGNVHYNSLYNVFVHHGLSEREGAGALVISYNVDAPGFAANFNEIGSADFYRPYFFRLYGWENAWD